jgi:hypothetical protein
MLREERWYVARLSAPRSPLGVRVCSCVCGWARLNLESDEAAERYLINHHLAAKIVQLQLVLLRQRVVMTVQKSQAEVLINRLQYALRAYQSPPLRAARLGAEGRSAAQEDFYARKRADAGVRRSCGVRLNSAAA